LFLAGTDGPIQAYPLPVQRKQLAAQANEVRRSVAGEVGGRAAALAGATETRDTAARILYRSLFPPAARPAVEAARRLVISPDDLLWEVPFAALVTNESGKPAYLGLQKPITYAQSLSLYAQAVQSPATPPTNGARSVL